MPPFSPPNRGQASLGSLLQPCSFHPHKFSLSPDSQCVSAHIHHQLQGGIPVFGSLTPGAALIVHGAFFRTDSPKLASPQPQSPPGSLRTDAKQLPTNRRLTETVPLRTSTGREEALQHKRSGSEVSGPAAEART